MNNTQVDNVKYLDIVMPMYNLIDYSDNYAKTSGSLWWYHKDIPNDNMTNSESFKFKARITGRTPAVGNTKHFEIVVQLKRLINFWRTIEILLINCEINLQLTWSANCVIFNETRVGTFSITNSRLYVPVVTLSPFQFTIQKNNQLKQLSNKESKYRPRPEFKLPG